MSTVAAGSWEHLVWWWWCVCVSVGGGGHNECKHCELGGGVRAHAGGLSGGVLRGGLSGGGVERHF